MGTLETFLSSRYQLKHYIKEIVILVREVILQTFSVNPGGGYSLIWAI